MILRVCHQWEGRNSLLTPRYFTQTSDAETMFDNANTKSQAWTDSLEVEAGDALAKFMTPVSAGLLHKSHNYQVFARHRLESTLRERDGVFLSVSDKAAFLVTVKARYGAEEEKELLADKGGLQDKFVLSDAKSSFSSSAPYLAFTLTKKAASERKTPSLSRKVLSRRCLANT